MKRATYLVGLGLCAAWSLSRPQNSSTPEPKRRDLGAFWQGLLNNLLNAKGTLFFLGVVTPIITPRTSSFEAATLTAAMLGTSASFWLAFVYALKSPRTRVLFARWQRPIDAASCVALILLGLRVPIAP